MKTCPFCAEKIQDAAFVCRFCQRELSGPNAGHITPPSGAVPMPSAPPRASTSVGFGQLAARRVALAQQTPEQRRAANRRVVLVVVSVFVGLVGLDVILMIFGPITPSPAEALRHRQIYNSLLMGESARSAATIYHTSEREIEIIRAEGKARGWALANLSTPRESTEQFVYQVNGENGAAVVSVTYESARGATQQEGWVYVPWSKQVSVTDGQFLYISAQNMSGSGCVIARITQGAAVLKEARSCGEYVIATASGRYSR